MRVKPNCMQCGLPFLGGKDGCCELCSSGQLSRRTKKRLRCMCGKRAIQVVFGEIVPLGDEPFEVELPLCRDCLRLEMELEASESYKACQPKYNPVNVIVVKSLPRAHAKMSGRRL
jgi:hypothetical protein